MHYPGKTGGSTEALAPANIIADSCCLGRVDRGVDPYTIGHQSSVVGRADLIIIIREKHGAGAGSPHSYFNRGQEQRKHTSSFISFKLEQALQKMMVSPVLSYFSMVFKPLCNRTLSPIL